MVGGSVTTMVVGGAVVVDVEVEVVEVEVVEVDVVEVDVVEVDVVDDGKIEDVVVEFVDEGADATVEGEVDPESDASPEPVHWVIRITIRAASPNALRAVRVCGGVVMACLSARSGDDARARCSTRPGRGRPRGHRIRDDRGRTGHPPSGGRRSSRARLHGRQ